MLAIILIHCWSFLLIYALSLGARWHYNCLGGQVNYPNVMPPSISNIHTMCYSCFRIIEPQSCCWPFCKKAQSQDKERIERREKEGLNS